MRNNAPQKQIKKMNIDDLIAQVVGQQQQQEKRQFIENEMSLQDFQKEFGTINVGSIFQDTAKNGKIKYFAVSDKTAGEIERKERNSISEKERIYLGESCQKEIDNDVPLSDLLKNKRISVRASYPVENTSFVRYQMYLKKDETTFSVAKKFSVK